MTNNKHISAYDQLVKHLHDHLQKTSQSLTNGLEYAKQKASEQNDLSEGEIGKIANFVQRDIEDIAHAINKPNSDSISEWFKFDIELLENFALDAFLSVADKTSVALAQLEERARQSEIYKTDEITSPGTFHCMQCNKELVFKTTTQIPTCPECGHDSFQRS